MRTSPRTLRSLARAVTLLALAPLAACESSGAAPLDSGLVVDAELPVGDVTYYEHVRPILEAHCVSCHQEGAIGPFALDEYAISASLAGRIMEVTRDRIMPPYLADASGACQTFADARWLSDRELAVLAAWAAQGAPEGDPSTPMPPRRELPSLGGTIATIDTGADYVPDGDVDDDYRCFVAEGPVETGSYYLTGYEVHPGNARAVHHVIVFAPQSDDASAAARALDVEEDGPGYTCYGAAGVQALPVALWAPGTGANLFPAGTGVQLEGGRPLIIQIHYNNLAVRGESDRSSVDLQIATEGVRAGRFIPIGDFDLSLEPRQSSAVTTAGFRISDFTTLPLRPTVYGLGPHMHTLGRSLRVGIQRASGGDEECLLDVPRWDFDWQLAYMFAEPLRIDVDDLLTITCEYDTTSRSEVVTWGEGTQDEMCLAFLYVVL